MMLAEAGEVIGKNIHIGLAFGGAAIGIGIAAAGGVIAMSRNPGLAGKILTFMFIGMALAQKSIFLAVLFSLPGYFFETIVCLLQAFVFAMLTIAFVGTLCTPSDEHGH